MEINLLLCYEKCFSKTRVDLYSGNRTVSNIHQFVFLSQQKGFRDVKTIHLVCHCLPPMCDIIKNHPCAAEEFLILDMHHHPDAILLIAILLLIALLVCGRFPPPTRLRQFLCKDPPAMFSRCFSMVKSANECLQYIYVAISDFLRCSHAVSEQGKSPQKQNEMPSCKRVSTFQPAFQLNHMAMETWQSGDFQWLNDGEGFVSVH